MRVLAHPFRLDGSGSVASVEQWGTAQLQQLVAAIVSTSVGERPLAPLFGITDPAGRIVSADEVRAAVELCEPDIRVVSASASDPVLGVQSVRVEAVWADDEE